MGPLREAAYRLIGFASCTFGETDDDISCSLEPHPGNACDAESLRARFHDLVVDENLRAKIATETSAVRNLILALAFGALAHQQNNSEGPQ